MRNWTTLLMLGMSLLIGSCQTVDVYEKHHTFSNQCWDRNVVIRDVLEIPDTLSAYDVYFVMRHRDQYPFSNIYIDLSLEQPQDTIRFDKVSLVIGNDATGWEGTGFDDIWEVRKRINKDPVFFKKPGSCQFVLKNSMSQNPLCAILSAGIRIEKCNQPMP